MITPLITRRRAQSKRLIWSLIAAAFIAAGCGDNSDGTPDPATNPDVATEISVAAASDLRPAFSELGKLFTNATGTSVTFSFGSSGQLREQIMNGAPFDLFASANSAYVDEVIAGGRGRSETKANYALGRIVLWSADDTKLPSNIQDLAAAPYRRIAIANPQHAPYGLAAKQALMKAGIYEQIDSRIVYGENISGTFQIAKSGNADAGIIALSLAIADGSAYTLIPSELHEPLQQTLVVTSGDARGNAAAAFATFINSEIGRKVMIRYGFILPGENRER